MSKFSDAERERIIAESFAVLARGQAEHEQPSTPVQDLPDQDTLLAEAWAWPIEDPLSRWKREADEQEVAFRLARRAERQRSTGPAPPVNVDLAIASAIADEREHVAALLVETIVEAETRQARAIDDALRPLRLELCDVKIANAELRIKLTELRAQLTADGGEIVDLPVLPLRGHRAN